MDQSQLGYRIICQFSFHVFVRSLIAPRFQKYLLVFVSIVTLLCICIILPFNFQVSFAINKVDLHYCT